MNSLLDRDEIARVALTCRNSVDQAVKRGNLDPDGSLEDAFNYIMLMRLKSLGVLAWADGLPDDSLPPGVQRGCAGIGEQILDRSDSQEIEDED